MAKKQPVKPRGSIRDRIRAAERRGDWQRVAGFPDYEVSKSGRVRRRTRGTATHAGLILKPRLVRGYLRVDLRRAGASHNRGVANLVAEAFLGKPPKYTNSKGKRVPKLVTHRDGDRENNAARNLAYVTRSESVLARMPVRNSQAKLTAAKVKTLRKRYRAGWTGQRLAKTYGISTSAALDAAKGRTWRNVPDA